MKTKQHLDWPKPSERHGTGRPLRYRLVYPGSRLLACPKRQDTGKDGALYPVACGDIRNTFDSCESCARNGNNNRGVRGKGKAR